MDAIAIVEKLNYYYPEGKGERQVLFDINLSIFPGEVIILTGESGSGKTTLLTLIGCLRSMREGSLKIFGEELLNASEKKRMTLRRRIGYIFQHFNLFEFMTVGQNVQSSLVHEKMLPAQARQQTQDLLTAVGLGDRLNSYPRELSGGQKQRVAISRALVHEPTLILADEPTAALDSETGRDVVNLIRNLAKDKGSAVLIVTHDRRILDIADRIVRIEDGKLITAYREEMTLALPTIEDQYFKQLEGKYQTKDFDPGEIVIDEGDDADTFYVIVEGIFEAVKIVPDSPPKLLRQMHKNEYFGEIGLLTPGSKRTATVRVSEDAPGKAIAIDRETFASLVKDSELTYAAVSHQLRKRLTDPEMGENDPNV